MTGASARGDGLMSVCSLTLWPVTLESKLTHASCRLLAALALSPQLRSLGLKIHWPCLVSSAAQPAKALAVTTALTSNLQEKRIAMV